MTPTRPISRRIARSLLTAPVRRTRPVDQLERLEDRCNPAPVATVSGLPADTQPLLGETVNYNVTFANTGTTTGYGPFIELAVDTSGPDGTSGGGAVDGIGTPSVTIAGQPLTPRGSVTLIAGQTTYVNPITGDTRNLAAVYGSRFNTGDTIYFYGSPFGSFTPAQTTTAQVTLPTSTRADVNTPMPVSIVGGFRDDEPALNGPAVYAARVDGTITPQLYRLTKIYTGPESETATGPNYVRRYRIEVDVATGQTVSDLRVTDALANTMQLVARDTTVIAGNPNIAVSRTGGSSTFVPGQLTATGGAATGAPVPTAPGGSITYQFLPGGLTHTGVAGVDAALEFNFYVPRDADTAGAPVAPDPANPTVPQGTDSTTATNTASSTLDWTPVDTRDPAQNDVGPAASGSVLSHTLEQQSVAIQKSATVVDKDTGAVVPAGQPIRPGQSLIRYTLNFQVSDYVALNDVFVRDVVGDGQRLYLGPVGGNPTTAFPTLTVTNAYLTGAPGTRQTTAGAFTGTDTIEYQRRYTAGTAASDPTSFPADGPTGAVFNALPPNVQPDGPTSDAGTTYLQFNVSQELQARLGPTAGRLVGAEILNDGTGPQNDNHPETNPPPGPVTGTIVFYVEVTDEFGDEFRVANGGSGDPTVDQGDVLGNTVNDPRTPARDGVFGDLISAGTINDPTPTVIGRGSDDSGTSVAIPYGEETKQLVAINGQGVPAQGSANPPFTVQAGDRVTYLLTYTLPISRFEDLKLVDFPPLPVMNLGQAPNNTATFTRDPAAYGFNPGEVGVFVSGVTPGGVSAAGFQSDTYFSTFAPGNGTGRNPILTIDAPNNSLTIDLGTQDDAQNRFTVVSVLVTFTVGNDPFATDLFLTNQLRVFEGSTNAGTTTVDDLNRFGLVRPAVNLYKGIVGTQAGAAAATGTTFGDVVFTGPGTAFGFSNQLNTVAEATALGNANTASLDAADRVRFALVAQNVGRGDAFDTRIRDVLPTGYVVPAAFPGHVFRGSGGAELVAGVDYTVVSYNATTGEFVIELTDNYTAGNVGGAAEDARGGGLSRGTRTDQALGNVAITNGSNAVVVLFDLTIAGTVAPAQALTNTATVPVYSNSDNGPNYTDPTVIPGATVPTDTATVTVPTAGTKSIVSTSEASTSEAGTGTTGSPRVVAVGEVVRYRLAFQLAEGTATNFQLRDNLPTGLTFLNDGSARVAFVSNGGGISSTTLAGAGLAVTGASGAVVPTFTIPPGAITGGSFVTGTDPLFSLGTLTNTDSDVDGEFVVVEFNALVDNSVAGSNDAGDNRDNMHSALVNGTSVFTSGLVRVRVAEPSITDLVKAANPTVGDAGDTITFTVTFSNPNAADRTTAFDLVLTDILPAVGYDTVAFVAGSLVTTGATNAAVAVAGNTVTFTADALAVGGTVSFQYTARLVANVGPGSYRNTANLTYTSLPGTNGTPVNPTGGATPGTPGTDTGERTGSGTNPNDYLDSDFEDVFVNAPVVKSIVGTNQAFTAGTTVAVGEQVQYQVVVTIPEGTTPTGVLRDVLPAGLAVVSLDSLTAVADVGLTTDAPGGFAGVLAAARAALAAPGQSITFNVGTLVNADRDPDGETLTFTYTVVVLNTAGNQRGTALTNSATTATGGVDRSTTSAPAVTVAEPTVRVTKTVTPTTGDASNADADAVTFTLVIDHAPASNADAFNIALTDAIPAGLTYVAGSLTNTAGVVPATLGASAGTLSASFTSLALGQSSTLTFRARLNGTTTPGQVVTNTAALTYTSLPGDVTAPQTPYNPASVERTGAGGVNDYVASDPEGVTVNSNAIGGVIYRDLDNDGLYEPGAGETLITSSIRVQLTGTDNLGFAVSTIITTATGSYNFTALRPGTYTLTQLDQPAGLLDGRDTPGTSTPGAPFGGTGTPAVTPRAPRDADAITTITIGLVGSKTGTNYNFGEVLPAQLGDFVWHDLNGNGRQDGGEPGLNGVAVTLTGTDDSGQPVTLNTTTATNAGNPGFYQFAGLRPSDAAGYVVTFGTLPGYVRTVRDSAVATDATNSDGDPTSGATAGVVLPAGGNNPTIDQGLYQPVSIGDRVYFDRDGDGVQDAGEPGIPGAAIEVVWLGPDGAFGGGDDLTFNATTGVDGGWLVINLPPGNFRVTATPPAGLGWALTDSLDNAALSATNPVTVPITSGVSRTDVDFGYRSTGSIGNRLYLDADGDGVQDANGLEPGLPGVTGTLRYDANADGDFTDPDDGLFTTVTDAAGLYTFGFLPPGGYQVSVAGAAGLPANVVLTDSLDNGALGATATVTKTLALGENEVTYDFGFQGNASLGDLVYYDADGDGVQDANEPGIAGAAVSATWVGPNGAVGGGDDVTFTTTTDALGNYLFPGLPAISLVGANPNYRVTVVAPAAFPIFTDSLDDAALNAVRPVDVQVSPTDGSPLNDRRDVDFGFRGTASLGDTVFLDSNGNGRQDGGAEVGIPGVGVSLFFDRNADGDFADAGEDVALATATTGAGGLYSFTSLAAGNYQVVFGTTAGGVTYTRTVQDSAVATDATDSDADPVTGRTGTYALANGDNNITADAGLYVPVSLGDRVYYDLNGDGVQQGTELGIPGVGIQVVWHGPDGVFGGGDDQTGNTTTGANGIWSVGNLPPGSYTVTATPPAGAGFDQLTDSLDNGVLGATNPVVVSTTSGVDRADIDFGYRGVGTVGDRVFLDINANGTFDAGEGLDGVTVTLSGDLNNDGTPDTLTTTTAADGFYQFPFLRVTAAGVPYTVTISTATLPQTGAGAPITNTVDPDTAGTGDNTSSLTLTAGAPSNQLQDFGYRGPGRIGDTVFLDANGNGLPDAGEGITGVVVRLRGDVDGDGTAEDFFATTTAAGVYDFSNLPVRDRTGTLVAWMVTVDPAGTTLPAGVANTTDPDGGNDGTAALTLDPANPVNLAQDFGYRGPGSIGDRVFLDVNASGSFDPGEGLTAVTVTLTADLNGDGVTETLTTTTDADGFYQLSGLPVFQNNGTAAVPYVVTVVASTVPAGLTNTVDPDTASPGDNTSSLTLSAGAPSNQAQDFGYRGTGALGDRVWIDSDGDSLQGAVALEPGLPGVGLTLTWSGADDTFGTADDVTGATTTDAAGNYSFNGLPLDLGRFRVVVTPATLPGNATQTFDLDGLATPNDAGTAAPITLTTAAPSRTDVDFGYVGSASLGDRVYVDQNRDGVQQASESGIPGAAVTLTWVGPDGDINTPADNVTFTTTTGANGLYLFPGLMVNGLADDYRVQVTLPVPGFTLTDSLDDGTLAATNPVDVVVSGAVGDPRTNRRDVDFGFAGAGSLAGTVFRDDSNEGTQDAGEPGIGGVVVTLTGTDVFGNPVLDPATGQPYTTTTDANGNYSFTGLPPGTYTITETQPTAYGDGIDREGSLAGTAGNDVISGIVVGPNQAGVGYTFGELPTFVSGTVFRDDNRDGAPQAGEPGIPNVRVELRDPVTNNLIAFTTTDATGGYIFDRLPAGNYRIVEIQPTGYADGPVGPATVRDVFVPTTGLTGQNFAEVLGSLSGRVYIDTDMDGTRDPGEPGIPGVTVTVAGTDVNGIPVNVTVTTDADGRYTVLNLFPAGEAGYTVTEGPTPLYADRAANVGTGFDTPGTAATPNQITGVNLTPGQSGVDYDFGEVTGSLSGFVYADFDMNGVRTLTGPRAETGAHVPGTNTPGGIAGVTITLTGTDGAGTAVSRTTTTAADGSYIFTGLAAGTYTLTETQPPLPSTLTNGFYDGAETQGSAGGTVVTPSPTFTADPNKNRIVLISLPAGADGTDYNFGELPPADPFGFVYVDANRNGVRDPGERGIPNVPVSISGTAFAGTAFARPLTAADVSGGLTQLTDANGRYEFVPIPAGLYTLTEDRQPAGYADGREQDGDSNGPPATVGNEVISNIALAPFPIRGPFNFGEVALPVVPGTLPPIDFFPTAPDDISKRQFLTTTPDVPTPPAAATAPNFAAFNPGARPAALAAVAEGEGGTGLVRVFDFAGGAERFRFRSYGDFAGGARVATADVTADGIPDVVVVPGAGGGPVVKVFDGNSGAEVRSFLAFEESFRGGLRVAAADLNGDFVADIIVTPDTGGGPIVRAFDGRTGAVIANFFALDPTFRGGLRVATGDVNRDGTADVVVTAGEGGGPRVAVYDGRTVGMAEPARLANDFFGFAPELRSGFWVSSADVDGDGFADVVMGAGAGGAPRVVVYSGRLLAAGDGPREVASFFAGEPADRGGARIVATDLEGDGRAEVLAGAGVGAWPLVGIYDPLTGLRRDVFYATSAPFRGGVEVG
ncbi:SdrD B-like domain-containing protein [Urbifossiella limnaea]|uniref:Serine-aspartate repeat-containing protein D n=1 Tax=Urbifossiella limnaea TaxID=2528023 RepID=A0A517XPL8_9BACT|nr:SdrD B-like domain-containing protein [Urbifossiella limnaea]QDU19434.1 Serine-aspartate repeat-containing protein D precursor [Urbifossiella limnaea]